MIKKILNTMEKAKIINEDPAFYGSFAEIGAGQEVARWFFRAGKASSTVAKTMSAYDMVFSDAIYGAEEHHRYVCESRLLNMLEKEYEHIKNRIWDTRGDRSKFFVFADTVASKSTKGNMAGHGWLGVRFQSSYLSEPSDVIIHVRMEEGGTLEQQESIGTVGVNLIYGAHFHHENPVQILEELCEGLRPKQVEIDMIRFTGPAFSKIDNRLMSLHLVRLGLTNAVLISPDGEAVQASEALYKKNIIVQRGRFKPLTNLHVDMLDAGTKQFLKDPSINKEDLISIMEITINNLLANGDVDVLDFLARVNILSSQGQYVLISNYAEYFTFSEFLAKYCNGKVGIIMGVGHLHKIFDISYYKNVTGGLLASLGLLFRSNIKALIYPAHSLSTSQPSPGTGEKISLITAQNYTPSDNLKYLYKYMYENHAIEDVSEFKTESLYINSEKVLENILLGNKEWEALVPKKAAQLIINEGLFGFSCQKSSQKKTG